MEERLGGLNPIQRNHKQLWSAENVENSFTQIRVMVTFGYHYMMFIPKNIHSSNVIQTEKVGFTYLGIYMCVEYAFIYTNMYTYAYRYIYA